MMLRGRTRGDRSRRNRQHEHGHGIGYNANESGRIENARATAMCGTLLRIRQTAKSVVSALPPRTVVAQTECTIPTGICPAEVLTLTAVLWIRSGRRTTLLSGGIFRIRSSIAGFSSGFYMGRLSNGNVRLLGKHIHDGCIYEVVMFDPMSISVSTEKPFCGIISVKKVIELFPDAERIPNSTYDNSYHHGSYFYDCNTTNADYVPQEEKEKLRQDWENNPQWLAYFPYVIGDKIHIVATSRCHIHHYIFTVCPTIRRFRRKPSKPTRCSRCMAWDLSMRESAILHRSTDGFTARV